MKRFACIALALAATLAAQVAHEANSGYQTEEQRKKMAASLGDPHREETQKPGLLIREMGLQPVLWNAMTSDWSEPSAERIAQHLSARIDRLRQRGLAANIVLHDGGHRDPNANREPSVTAAGMLIERYKATHRFVTVDAWG